jgi:hypothetical protein
MQGYRFQGSASSVGFRPSPTTYRWTPGCGPLTTPMDGWCERPEVGPPHTDRDYPHDLARQMRDWFARRAWEREAV